MKRGIVASFGLLTAVAFGQGQTPPASPRSSVPPVKATVLAVKGARPPSPVLKYQLLPDVTDLVPGNAAVIYYRAFSPEWSGIWRRPGLDEKMEQWKDMPLADLPRKEMEWLHRSNPLKEIDRAARYEQCDWQLRDRTLKEGISLLLPDLQTFRQLANQLAVRARLEMAEGDFDKAVYTLQTGFAVARHLNEGTTLIHGLVAISIAQAMAGQLETLLQAPNAPNFYWALTDLPKPMFDMRKTLLAEKLIIQSAFPGLHEIRTAVMTPERINQALDHALGVWGYSDNQFHLGDGSEAQFQTQVLVTALVAKAYSRAKDRLIQKGMDEGMVESMPAKQVVLVDSLDHYFKARDELFKWANVPYYQAFEGLQQAQASVRRSRGTTEEGLPIASLFLPALEKAFYVYYQMDRRIAALRCVEAIRLYAAAHDGKLPERLADIKEVPIPLDPATGQDFQYSTSGNTATLAGPTLPNQPSYVANAIRYELTLNP